MVLEDRALRSGRAFGRAWALTLPLVVAAPACSLTQSLDYLSNGPRDAGTASATDAPTDAAGTWCTTQPMTLVFCADFDENDLQIVYEMGSLVTVHPTLDTQADASITGDAKSPPGAFLAASPALSGSTGGSSDLRYAEPISGPGATSASVHFAVRFVDISAGPQPELASLYMEDPNHGEAVRAYVVLIDSTTVGLQIDNGSGNPSPVVQKGLPAALGAWHDYVARIDLGTPPSAKLTIDDMPWLEVPLPPPAPSFTTASATTFAVGTSVTLPSPPFQIAFDNVTFPATAP